MIDREDPAEPVHRLITWEALIGGAIAAGLPLNNVKSATGMPIVELAVVLGALVVVPLAVAAGVRGSGRNWPHRMAWSITVLQPFAGSAVVTSLFLEVGLLSAVLASLWFFQTVLVALMALKRLGLRGTSPLHEFIIDIGHLYLPVGGFWFVMSRLGYQLMGFGPDIVGLTAVHFHYAGLAAPVISGQVGRLIKNGNIAYRIGATIVAATPILVAVGFVGSLLLEVMMSILLALGVVTVAIVVLIFLLPRLWRPGESFKNRFAYLLLSFSQIVSFGTMLLACFFAIGKYLERPIITLGGMVGTHGLWNAVAFAVPSLISLHLLAPRRDSAIESLPFQQLCGSVYIGASFFDRYRDSSQVHPPTGLLENLNELVHKGNLRASIHPNVDLFFKNTQDFVLCCRPHWQPGFKVLGRIYCWLAARIGQLVLPGDGGEHRITSKLIWLNQGTVGLPKPVGSARTYEDGSPMYIASYTQHRDEQTAYMNIALPLPGGALQSILVASPLDGNQNGEGLCLTSENADGDGHQGIWLSVFGFSVKLPLQETLHAWSADFPGSVTGFNFGAAKGALMVAQHTFRLFGRPCLILDYVIGPKGNWPVAGSAFSD